MFEEEGQRKGGKHKRKAPGKANPLALAVEKFLELRSDCGAQPICVATGEIRLPAVRVAFPQAARLGRFQSKNYRKKRSTLLLLRLSSAALILLATLISLATIISLATLIFLLSFLTALIFLTFLIFLLRGRGRRRSYSSLSPAAGVLGVVIVSSFAAGGHLRSKFVKVSLVGAELKLLRCIRLLVVHSPTLCGRSVPAARMLLGHRQEPRPAVRAANGARKLRDRCQLHPAVEPREELRGTMLLNVSLRGRVGIRPQL